MVCCTLVLCILCYNHFYDFSLSLFINPIESVLPSSLSMARTTESDLTRSLFIDSARFQLASQSRSSSTLLFFVSAMPQKRNKNHAPGYAELPRLYWQLAHWRFSVLFVCLLHTGVESAANSGVRPPRCVYCRTKHECSCRTPF